MNQRVFRATICVVALLFSPSVVFGQIERPSLRIATSGQPNTLDPQREVSNVGNPIIANIFDTLIRVDPSDNYALKPGLAVEWQRVDDRTIDLTLRQDVLFHDGSSFDADDVLFTFSPDRILSSDWPGSMQVYWSGITFEKSGPYSIRVKSEEPDQVLEYRLGHSTASIISQSAFENAPSVDAWSRAPIGTGPYSVREFQSGNLITLEAFDDYWGGEPPAGIVEWLVTPEVAGRIAGLAGGDFDIITNVPPDQIQQVDNMPTAEVVGGAVNNILLYVFDTQNDAYADKRIRQALNLCIDRNAIVKSLWAGRTAVPNGNQYPAFGDLYIADHPAPQYDPERALTLAKEAGYAGEPLPLRIRTNYYPNEVATAEIAAAMCNAAGLNLQIEIKESSPEMWGALRAYSNSMQYPDPVGALLRNWGKNSAEAELGILASVDTDRFHVLENIMRTSFDLEVRREAFAEILEWWDEEVPGILLYQNANFYGKSTSIEWNPSSSFEMDFRPGALAF